MHDMPISRWSVQADSDKQSQMTRTSFWHSRKQNKALKVFQTID
ncbi:hypothetical protein SynBIOSU31_01806 [Synechococcus sp. BIOS-U3-1]|nr:hypothetical protein SynBIOSU31_01806 [Synechococcus sp. BIOS-U3-1]